MGRKNVSLHFTYLLNTYYRNKYLVKYVCILYNPNTKQNFFLKFYIQRLIVVAYGAFFRIESTNLKVVLGFCNQ